MQAALEGVDDLRVLLSSAKPEVRRWVIDDSHGGKVDIAVTVRRMGTDNGMDTLVEVDRNLRRAVKHTLGVTRHAGAGDLAG
jgi:hypothetical protein